ncbi:MAG: winged helix-turn-helix domain-containing protein [Anaerolineae bacterium]|nr:winged helix-turn-helix domain-containing protein [Anaerolineae bacterium]
MRRDVFQAIADPRRRAILDLLVKQKLTVNEVAEYFDISRPAISRHIKILVECGLVEIHQHGRERHCQVRLDQLGDVSIWVEQYRQQWQQRFERLDEYLQEVQQKEKAQ